MSTHIIEPKLISTAEEYRELTKQFQQKYRKAVTSNYLMPAEAAAAIADGQLYWDECPGVFLLLCEKSRIIHAYVSASQDAVVSLRWPLEKPCIMDVPFRAQQTDELSKNDPLWRTLGFSLRTTHARMLWTPENPDSVDALFSQVLDEPSITAEHCENWYACLDTVALDVPDAPRALVGQEHMLAIRDEQGRVASQMMVVPGKKVADTHFLVTLPAHRGKGLAKEMMRGAFRVAHESGSLSLCLWVDTSNAPAISSYTRLGYRFDRMLSAQYTLAE